jgi:hypothetical protein
LKKKKEHERTKENEEYEVREETEEAPLREAPSGGPSTEPIYRDSFTSDIVPDVAPHFVSPSSLGAVTVGNAAPR